MARGSSRQVQQAKQEEEVNFFIPMVDLMVSIVFVFIIIVMVLLLLIKASPELDVPSDTPASASVKGQGTPVKSSIIDDVVANQSAQEILFNDVIKELLQQDGSTSSFDAKHNKLEIKVSRPEQQENENNKDKK